MPNNLVIVESPAKAKTIEKFLGESYKVMSSFGHIRDLRKKDFGVDIANQFQPVYEIPTDKRKLVQELKTQAKKADTVWLASDEDREGEAIAWHLAEVLELDQEKTNRIVFHEITKEAILAAIKKPRRINSHLVDAQQARRVLDRIVGFELSPVLWRKIKPSLSAGRVQSVAVRLIVEKEREIQQFEPEVFFRVSALFTLTAPGGTTSSLKADLGRRFKTETEARDFLLRCKDARFSIMDITTKPARKSPAPPFTTSTLQQEAARKLGMSVSQTMMVAQRLYESGKITYMRTDSVNLSSLAIHSSKAEIEAMAGERYVKIRRYQTKSKGAQEAHEAIRPTYMNVRSIDGNAQEKRLYELIWKRTIASQMADAELEKTTVTIGMSNAPETFEAVGEVLIFDGFLKVYMESYDEEGDADNGNRALPPISKEDLLTLETVTATERFTQRSFRYTEASLVRKLEELGIGRPSTYAPTISTIQQREYVKKEDREGQLRTYKQLELLQGTIHEQALTETVGAEKGKLFPTDIGIVVNDFLLESFPDILDYNFTASVEKQFDQIAEGHIVWNKVIADFYASFHPAVEQAAAWSKQKVGERILGTDPATGKPVSVRIGRFGPIVQIGAAEDEEKPQFASLQKGQHMDTITLEDALSLFKLPRTVGDYEGKPLTVGVGRYGPYVRYDGGYVSIPKTYDPLEIDLDTCIELIRKKLEEESNRVIRHFETEGIQVLNGRFGPYLTKDGLNYRIPKTTDPTTLTLEDCQALIEAQKDRPTNGSYRKRGTKSASTTKTTTKTSSTKTTTGKKTTSTQKAASSTKKSTGKATKGK